MEATKYKTSLKQLVREDAYAKPSVRKKILGWILTAISFIFVFLKVSSDYSNRQVIGYPQLMAFTKVHLGRPYRIVFTINVEVLRDLRGPIFHATAETISLVKE